MSKKHTLDRRQFVAAASTVAVFSIVPRHVLGGTEYTAPSEKLNHACIGVGGMMGVCDFKQFLENTRVKISAICDVDKNFLNAAAVHVPEARKYTDWREMLVKESDKIDSVNIAVPDHMHTMITLAFLEAGKHVYCQKPLCHDIAECRAVAQAAKKHGCITQLGTQAASGVRSKNI